MGHFPKGFRTFAQYNRRQHLIPWGAAPITQPPFSAGTNIWSFDPDGVGAAQYITGPTGTVTTPVKTQGAGGPSYYTFGATDRIDFGDALDTTFAGATPQFTLYTCVSPSSGDLAAAASIMLSKDDGSAAREWVFFLAAGKPTFAAFSAANGSTTFASRATSAAITTGRHVLAVAFDGTLSVGVRTVLYVDGVAVAMAVETATGTGIVDTAATLRIGERADALPPPAVLSYAYAYSGVHSAGTVASISSWLQNTKGWK